MLVPTYNKTEFDLDLAALTAKSSEVCPVSLLFMDLDKFKSINDVLADTRPATAH